ncbi:MAG: PIN domain-containing protein [Caulobacterales bacterium]
MIVVDASAILAIYLREPEREEFLEILAAAPEAEIAPINAWEVLARAQSLYGAAGAAEADALISALAIVVPPSTLDDVRAAVAAFARFGRTSPAKLNLGDCFAYALAQKRRAPLLFKGDDFAQTDVIRVQSNG